jgi:hypothetical protein
MPIGYRRINVKLGGINAKVEHAALSHLTKHNTMILGADVTHPGIIRYTIGATPSNLRFRTRRLRQALHRFLGLDD